MRQQLRNRRWLHWLLLGAIVLMLLAVNGINAGIGFIARDITNALVAKQHEGFNRILAIYASCFIVALPGSFLMLLSVNGINAGKLGLIWREWLSSGID